jgi:hypothetical protein
MSGNDKSFSLTSREDVVIFERLLDQYARTETGLAREHIRLVDAYDALRSREDGRFVFTALLDLQINFVLMCRDRHNTLAVRNTYFSDFFGKQLEADSILDSRDAFFAKMEIQRSTSSFVLRYRALFDKIMGLIILMFAPTEYEAFCGARRKKNSFKKIAANMPQVPSELVGQIDRLLTEFDERFRTPEAHGTGALRKWVFLMEPHWNNPQVELMVFHNYMNSLMVNIGRLFKKPAND